MIDEYDRTEMNPDENPIINGMNEWSKRDTKGNRRRW